MHGIEGGTDNQVDAYVLAFTSVIPYRVTSMTPVGRFHRDNHDSLPEQ